MFCRLLQFSAFADRRLEPCHVAAFWQAKHTKMFLLAGLEKALKRISELEGQVANLTAALGQRARPCTEAVPGSPHAGRVAFVCFDCSTYCCTWTCASLLCGCRAGSQDTICSLRAAGAFLQFFLQATCPHVPPLQHDQLSLPRALPAALPPLHHHLRLPALLVLRQPLMTVHLHFLMLPSGTVPCPLLTRVTAAALRQDRLRHQPHPLPHLQLLQQALPKQKVVM